MALLNDMLLTVDSDCSAVPVLLNLTAAFDIVDYNTLLSPLDPCVSTTLMAL